MHKSKTLRITVLFLFLQACNPFFPEEIDPDLLLDGPLEGLTHAQNASFAEGDEAFGKIFSPKTGLGPIFNMHSCSGCHSADGKGHPATNLVRFGKDLGGGAFDYMIEKGGPQLQDRAVPGYPAEVLPDDATGISERSALIVAGVGFLESVPDSVLLNLADPSDTDGDGISGRVNYVHPPDFFKPQPHHIPREGKYIGRFGRKAIAIDLLQQTVQAYLNDMGITSDFLPEDIFNPLAGGFSGDNVADPEVGSAAVRNVVFYLRTLKFPVPRNTDDPGVVAGKQLFLDTGCAACHLPALRTGQSEIAELSEKEFYPFSDLLLHDMGEELADHFPEGDATGTEWRTTPLWGLGLIKDNLGGVPYYLHDGRTSELRVVIQSHGGEGSQSRDNFNRLTPDEQDQLIQFLESL